MTVETISFKGNQARVQHSIPDDPMCRSFYTLVEVVGDHSKGDATTVKVGTPLVCPQPLSNLEVTSVVQLITGHEARVGTQPIDTCDSVEEKGCPRCWTTYELTWP